MTSIRLVGAQAGAMVAWLVAGIDYHMADMAKIYGADTATAMMMEAHHESLAYLKHSISDNQIACDFSNNGRFRGFYQPHEYQQNAESFSSINDWLG